MSADRDGIKLNGLAVKSWGDVVAVATLLSLFLAVLAWGLKLETELNAVRSDLLSVQARVADGILPRAEERIARHDDDIEDIEREINRVRDRLEKLEAR